MGFFGIFSGRSPESHEERADAFMRSGAFGDALIEYEKALDKIEKRFPEKAHLKDRLGDKLGSARNALAKTHLEDAEIMIKAGEHAEARELFQLAMELAEDGDVKRKIEQRLADFVGSEAVSVKPPPVYDREEPGLEEEEEADEEDEYDEEIFSVLCHALPEEMQEAYQGYGRSFVSGYVALNDGDFQAAARHLEDAMAENSGHTLIPLELATAYIHLDANDEAAELLESFVAQNPEQTRAYQLLCEIYWGKKDFDRSGRLLSQVPDSIKHAKAMLLLQGENRFQKKEYAAAEAIFNECAAIHGKDEIISRALAKTLEASGRTEEAKALYAEIINKCHSCGTRADPFLKRRYAELCYQSGDTSKNLLDIYLGLVQEDPDNRSAYFGRISDIFHHKGEFDEARRFQTLAKSTES
ncbi:MAG: tetratricopeptide repeat protein [Desulfosalsimonadaceae bacterium]